MRRASYVFLIALAACGDRATNELPMLDSEQFISSHQESLDRLDVDISENEINLVRHIDGAVWVSPNEGWIDQDTIAWIGGPSADQLFLMGQYANCPVFEREFHDDYGRIESTLDHAFEIGARQGQGCANRETRAYGFADKNRFGERIWKCPLQVISLRLAWSESVFDEAVEGSKRLCTNTEYEPSE